MSAPRELSEDPRARDFAAQAQEPPSGFLRELWYFLRHNKKWWLTPIVVVLLVLGLLVFLGGTGAAPFIYTLF
ncbi:MAG TPA: DUF5989 family protein [Polyangia bacterium]|jgi:hypothetical protein